MCSNKSYYEDVRVGSIFLALPYRIERHEWYERRRPHTYIFCLFIITILLIIITKLIAYAVLILTVQNNRKNNAKYAHVKYEAGSTDAWKLQLLNSYTTSRAAATVGAAAAAAAAAWAAAAAAEGGDSSSSWDKRRNIAGINTSLDAKNPKTSCETSKPLVQFMISCLYGMC